MGLDSVELLLEVEATFNIDIPDEEAAGIVTIGELHKSILEKMRGRNTKTSCGSQKAFYRLRRTLMDFFGVERREIRTCTSTEDMFPRENRKEIYQILACL
ncbi:MAG: hypothetical protein ISS70_04975 [Phycisphaerae bacterium]|nr:hypothetical protein [Phycisphaerae bacterium]